VKQVDVRNEISLKQNWARKAGERNVEGLSTTWVGPSQPNIYAEGRPCDPFSGQRPRRSRPDACRLVCANNAVHVEGHRALPLLHSPQRVIEEIAIEAGYTFGKVTYANLYYSDGNEVVINQKQGYEGEQERAAARNVKPEHEQPADERKLRLHDNVDVNGWAHDAYFRDGDEDAMTCAQVGHGFVKVESGPARRAARAMCAVLEAFSDEKYEGDLANLPNPDPLVDDTATPWPPGMHANYDRDTDVATESQLVFYEAWKRVVRDPIEGERWKPVDFSLATWENVCMTRREDFPKYIRMYAKVLEIFLSDPGFDMWRVFDKAGVHAVNRMDAPSFRHEAWTSPSVHPRSFAVNYLLHYNLHSRTPEHNALEKGTDELVTAVKEAMKQSSRLNRFLPGVSFKVNDVTATPALREALIQLHTATGVKATVEWGVLRVALDKSRPKKGFLAYVGAFALKPRAPKHATAVVTAASEDAANPFMLTLAQKTHVHKGARVIVDGTKRGRVMHVDKNDLSKVVVDFNVLDLDVPAVVVFEKEHGMKRAEDVVEEGTRAALTYIKMAGKVHPRSGWIRAQDRSRKPPDWERQGAMITAGDSMESLGRAYAEHVEMITGGDTFMRSERVTTVGAYNSRDEAVVDAYASARFPKDVLRKAGITLENAIDNCIGWDVAPAARALLLCPVFVRHVCAVLERSDKEPLQSAVVDLKVPDPCVARNDNKNRRACVSGTALLEMCEYAVAKDDALPDACGRLCTFRAASAKNFVPTERRDVDTNDREGWDDDAWTQLHKDETPQHVVHAVARLARLLSMTDAHPIHGLQTDLVGRNDMIDMSDFVQELSALEVSYEGAAGEDVTINPSLPEKKMIASPNNIMITARGYLCGEVFPEHNMMNWGMTRPRDVCRTKDEQRDYMSMFEPQQYAPLKEWHNLATAHDVDETYIVQNGIGRALSGGVAVQEYALNTQPGKIDPRAVLYPEQACFNHYPEGHFDVLEWNVLTDLGDTWKGNADWAHHMPMSIVRNVDAGTYRSPLDVTWCDAATFKHDDDLNNGTDLLWALDVNRREVFAASLLGVVGCTRCPEDAAHVMSRVCGDVSTKHDLPPKSWSTRVRNHMSKMKSKLCVIGVKRSDYESSYSEMDEKQTVIKADKTTDDDVKVTRDMLLSETSAASAWCGFWAAYMNVMAPEVCCIDREMFELRGLVEQGDGYAPIHYTHAQCKGVVVHEESKRVRSMFDRKRPHTTTYKQVETPAYADRGKEHLVGDLSSFKRHDAGDGQAFYMSTAGTPIDGSDDMAQNAQFSEGGELGRRKFAELRSLAMPYVNFAATRVIKGVGGNESLNVGGEPSEFDGTCRVSTATLAHGACEMFGYTDHAFYGYLINHEHGDARTMSEQEEIQRDMKPEVVTKAYGRRVPLYARHLDVALKHTALTNTRKPGATTAVGALSLVQQETPPDDGTGGPKRGWGTETPADHKLPNEAWPEQNPWAHGGTWLGDPENNPWHNVLLSSVGNVADHELELPYLSPRYSLQRSWDPPVGLRPFGYTPQALVTEFEGYNSMEEYMTECAEVLKGWGNRRLFTAEERRYNQRVLAAEDAPDVATSFGRSERQSQLCYGAGGMIRTIYAGDGAGRLARTRPESCIDAQWTVQQNNCYDSYTGDEASTCYHDQRAAFVDVVRYGEEAFFM